MIKNNKKLQGKLFSRVPNIHIETNFFNVTQKWAEVIVFDEPDGYVRGWDLSNVIFGNLKKRQQVGRMIFI